jgi:hypothetical protein
MEWLICFIGLLKWEQILKLQIREKGYLCKCVLLAYIGIKGDNCEGGYTKKGGYWQNQ